MLIFSIIDNKNDCTSVFAGGKIYKNINRRFLSKTWSWNEKLDGLDVEYAQIYCGGLSKKQICPENLKKQFLEAEEQKRRFEKTFMTAKVSLEECCFFDLVPDWFIQDYFSIENKIIEYVFDVFEKPKNHDFLVKLSRLANEIGKYEINHDLQNYQKHTFYNIFGTITGRFGLEPHSFPILNLSREKRKKIFPNNDFFISLDYNGAEIRTALGLAGKSQPEGDVYEAFRYLFPGKTRDEVKKEIITLWYNPKQDFRLTDIIEKDKFIETFWDGKKIETFFGRTIECDREHVIPYMNQGTTAELVFERCFALQEFLKTKNSKISFIIHDEVILDIDSRDLDLLPEIEKIFSQTKLGNFVVRSKKGYNLGEMGQYG